MLSTGHSVSRLLAQRCPSCWIRHEFLGEALGNRKGLAASTSANPSSDLNGLWVMLFSNRDWSQSATNKPLRIGASDVNSFWVSLALVGSNFLGGVWMIADPRPRQTRIH